MKIARPIIAITMGDPAGIGPEIVAKALARREVYKLARPLVVGDAQVMRQGTEIAAVDLSIRPIARVEEAAFEPGGMDVLDLRNIDVTHLEVGKVSASAGNAAFEAVEKAIELALGKHVDATVTGPIHKEALNAAGHKYAGHTEIFAHYTRTTDYAMLLIYGDLRVIHVTTHVPLRKVSDLITKARVLRVIELADAACRTFGVQDPRIAVAGLNPHASDGGLFGREEQDQITPAVEAARAAGIRVEGPLPPDTLFPQAIGGWFDICVAMYHDQGHIPLKMAGFRWDRASGRWESVNGVNITLGLPIIRTSVDHGTAFDIAGKGIASPDSMIHAIEYAAKLARERRK
jgi:4-phospho-D-threonate 3-dehydrogenase / 4-phospho-D-erythronate 3-dehydrogenase